MNNKKQLALVTLAKGFFTAEEEWFQGVCGYVPKDSFGAMVAIYAHEAATACVMSVPLRNVGAILYGKPPKLLKQFYDTRTPTPMKRAKREVKKRARRE